MHRLWSVIFALAVLAALDVWTPTAGHAEPYKWCATFGSGRGGGARNCGFVLARSQEPGPYRAPWRSHPV